MLPLDLKRNSLLWILGLTLAIGLGTEAVRFALHRPAVFPLRVVQGEEARELKRVADSIMLARAAALQAPVNINSASVAELETLDGIGPALAERIVAFREAGGPFAAVDDLDAVPGIGPKRLAAIRDRCVVR